jgi:hypothetical protein
MTTNSDYTIKVPPAEVVSSQDGNVVKFRQKQFRDEHDNSVEPEQLSASRWANRIKVFFRSLQEKGND